MVSLVFFYVLFPLFTTSQSLQIDLFTLWLLHLCFCALDQINSYIVARYVGRNWEKTVCISFNLAKYTFSKKVFAFSVDILEKSVALHSDLVGLTPLPQIHLSHLELKIVHFRLQFGIKYSVPKKWLAIQRDVTRCAPFIFQLLHAQANHNYIGISFPTAQRCNCV